MKTLAFYLITFLLIFGIKINNFLDISLITSILLFLYLLISGKMQSIKPFVSLLGILAIFLTYIIVLSLFTMNVNFTFIGRAIRCLIGLFSIPAYYLSNQLPTSKKLNIFLNVLATHAFVVIVSSFLPLLQDFIRPISGFGLPASMFRSTGFTNGYDFSGTICLIGLIVELVKPAAIRKNYVRIIGFVAASLLTSRVTMALLFAIITLFVLFLKSIKKFVKVLFVIFIVVMFIPIAGIVLYSIGETDNFIIETFMKVPFLNSISEKIVYYYSSTDINSTFTEHYDFNGLNAWQLVFGSLLESGKDPGYVQYIFSVGIVGLFVVLCFYIYISTFCLINSKRYHKKNIIASYLFSTIVLVVTLLLLVSAKNSYLLARHVSEILLIMLALAVSSTNSKFVMDRRFLTWKLA